MKIYNTLTRKNEEFKALLDKAVTFYSCGPTVYDHQTIGNLRTYVLYDTLRRVLEAEGLEVKHVMNITDVGHLTSDGDEGEDKLEKGAKSSGKTVWEVAGENTEEFKRNLEQLNVSLPRLAKATDFIEQQIAMVQTLLDKGFAYQTDQAIYFDVSKLDSYGRLTGQKLTDKEVGARAEVVVDENKRHPQDFALWFFLVGRFANHEMNWASPWGQGFPGWHLECSAIVHSTLGDPIDIHSGAVDLIGTHHTNEMAQTEAAYGNSLANYWVHGEHLLVDGRRMGKSLGNFYTIKDVTDKGYEPLSLRLLYLQAHYRTQLNFTWRALSAAEAHLKNLQAWADLKFQSHLGHKNRAADVYGWALDKIKVELNNDLNTPQALSELSKLVALAEHEGVDTQKLQPFLEQIDRLFGLRLAGRQDIGEVAKSLIAQRESARLTKDWVKADQLRRQLSDQGIEINDTEHGPIWSRSARQRPGE
ncbi:cysteine--tRNA ligase [Candidatus Saccharibacteria bacterium RIFCSPHIGHO2_12_FULL_49_19]|nr:MAG: cysteine--tRNA ligase [Candidatus Saccharibacteria bacterium RIFCSPHIGHO2_12_FULL_49_19]OGL38545.1 MAG: cysteine--tRNA ligase [Candidatus Saccharibacteria bacterium RIFCSPLOWO2_01_FULL_49_22]